MKNENFWLVVSIFVCVFLLIPKEKQLNVKQKLEYVNDSLNQEVVFLNDKNDFIARTSVTVSSDNLEDKIKEIVDVLIKSGKKDSSIPTGFKNIISNETVLNKVEVVDGTAKLDFNEHLLDESEEKVIESLTYSLTDLEGVKNIIIYINGDILTSYKFSKKKLVMPLDRSIGINKVYDINNLNDIVGVTSYFINEHNDNYYYVPITKFSNDDRDKIEIIVDELNSSKMYSNELLSVISRDVYVISSNLVGDTLEVVFNDSILNENNIIVDDIINSIVFSINDNYIVKNVVFYVENREILKKVL